jgi:hypothetical protein
MHSFLQYLRFGARMLRKNPGFAIAAIFTLALGIGGNTAIFTITSSVLLKALPYPSPQQLISLDVQGKDGQSHCCSLNRFDIVHDRSQSFSGVVTAANDNFNLTGRGEPLQVPSARVSANFFDVLGVKPQAGRFFVPDESQAAGPSRSTVHPTPLSACCRPAFSFRFSLPLISGARATSSIHYSLHNACAWAWAT